MTEPASPGPASDVPGRRTVVDTLRLLRSRTTEGIEGAARLLRGDRDPDLPERDRRRLASLIDAGLDPRLGPVVARARAAEVAEVYRDLGDLGRRRFFALLADEYGTGHAAIDEAIAAYQARVDATEVTGGPDTDVAPLRSTLRDALVPGWERLFRLFIGLDRGVKFTVDLRADLLGILADRNFEDAQRAALTAVDADLRGLLEQIFDVGLLDLRRITWDTSATVLEKLIAYEAVHEITSWSDLKNRLRPDRRCFGFFHPGMPDEPVIFVEVALVEDLPDRIAPLLDQASTPADPRAGSWAIFYSISACQQGLAGVGLGEFLIKRVVTDLRRDLPNLRNFATLSPIPGFHSWLRRQVDLDAGAVVDLLDAEGMARAAQLGGGAEPSPTPRPGTSRVRRPGQAGPAAETRAAAVAGVQRLIGTEPLPVDGDAAMAARELALRLCAHYLVRERRGVGVADRVANFHLTNGARVERLHWAANAGSTGQRESLGLMVNYRYDLDKIEENHLDYLVKGRVAVSTAVSKLLS